MNSSLHTINASMIISWLVIAGLFLLVIFQYREVTRYRRRFNRLLGERLGLDGEGRAPHSTQSWFVGELKGQRSLRHHEPVSFIDQVELVDDVGRTQRLAIAHAQRYKTPLALAMFDIDLKPCTPPRKPGATGWWRTPVQATGRLRLDVRLPAP